MNTVVAGTLAMLLSLGALAMLAAQDAKRRRVFGLPEPVTMRPTGLLWGAALAPALLAAVWGGVAGFVFWLGATSVSGWVLAARRPGAGTPLRASFAAPIRLVVQALLGMVAVATSAVRERRGRFERLEARLAIAEAQLAVLVEQQSGAGVASGSPVGDAPARASLQ